MLVFLKRILYIFITLSIFSTAVQSQTLDSLKADAFLKALVTHDSSLTKWVLRSELDKSRRLGIDFRTPFNKFFIQYDIADNIRRIITRGRVKYQFEIDTLEKDFSKLTFKLKARDYDMAFYFKGSSLISPYYYHTRDWKEFVTKYFRIRTSNPRLFASTAADQLDAFVDEMIALLQIGPEKAAVLRQQKIDYLLCESTDEIETISGFNTRGVTILATDRVITTFPLHKHEVAHVLINMVLENPPLFVHPFMQEGFATATGGRGGKVEPVIREIGTFLQKSAFMTVAEILGRKEFRNSDASLSYPLSGVYNAFLLQHWPLERYLNLYQAMGAVSSKTVPHKVPTDSLPKDSLFNAYVEGLTNSQMVTFPTAQPDINPLIDAHWGKIWEQEDRYVFTIRGGIQLTPPQPVKQLVSSEFRAIFPDIRYSGQQFFLEVTKGEVKLFNFYTANLDAFYSTGLTMNPVEVQREDGNFHFTLPKSVFSYPIEQMTITQ
ncbi:MAG: hypothetical protein ACRBF0_00250 [Calditrichia bacterium]